MKYWIVKAGESDHVYAQCASFLEAQEKAQILAQSQGRHYDILEATHRVRAIAQIQKLEAGK